MKVLVASENPVKINAVKEAFSNFFDNCEVIGRKVDSGVPAQPVQNDTYIGAKNRAHALMELNVIEKLNANFFVGIEGGVAEYYNNWFAFGCMCVMDNNGNEAYGTSPHFELPKDIIDQLLQGKELGDVIDAITNEEDSKQKGGAVGFLTRGVMNRTEIYTSGLISALIPFLNRELYFNSK